MTAPVITDGSDAPVNEVGQWLATGLTYALALAAVVYVLRICLRDRVIWPGIILASGGLTCLLEPLFDHLYGLWFYEEGQWHLYTTFGSNQPVWVPGAYLAFYGGATVIIARTLARRPNMRTVWTMYGSIVAMALVAEITYISVLEVYCYQDRQPFVVLGYPIFLAFTNAMSAVVSGIVAYRLVPLLRGPSQLYLITLVPGAFAMGLFGTGILYLSVRHSAAPSMILVSLGALTVAGGIAWTVRMLGRHLVDGREPVHPSLRPGHILATDQRLPASN